MSLASRLLKRHITSGGIELVHPDGQIEHLGPDAPAVRWEFCRKGTLQRILLHPTLHLGETYMNGEWTVSNGSIADLLRVLRANVASNLAVTLHTKLAGLFWHPWNSVRNSVRNAQHHYDLPHELFECMLDKEMHYSCALFTADGQTLEEAQQQKANHIRRKLLLKPGARVLDIGCGWGPLAMHLASACQVHVTGITVASHQLEAGRATVEERGLSNLVDIRLADYRELEGKYDAIVSVGMFEHVGTRNYRKFFRCVAKLLKPRGVALLHTIGYSSSPTPTNPWIKRHIFPGGYIPSLSEVMTAIEASGLVASDIEVWRRHYARTLHEWNRRFQSERARFSSLKGEKFCRMWEFYLALSETAFELDDLVVFQIQLAAENDTVPLTRDYAYTG